MSEPAFHYVGGKIAFNEACDKVLGCKCLAPDACFDCALGIAAAAYSFTFANVDAAGLFSGCDDCGNINGVHILNYVGECMWASEMPICDGSAVMRFTLVRSPLGHWTGGAQINFDSGPTVWVSDAISDCLAPCTLRYAGSGSIKCNFHAQDILLAAA